jgi:prepilin-type processing-associated H-X9-DG protein
MRPTMQVIFSVVTAAVLLGCLGMVFPLQLGLYLAFGWVIFLAKVLPQVQVAWSGVALAVICLGAFAVGVHWFLGWMFAQIRPERRWKLRWTASLVGVIVVMFVAGLATAGMAHQAGWLLTAKDSLTSESWPSTAARRAQSMNNLKQMALALRSYHDHERSFPPGGTFDRQGQPQHSWMTSILPYIEQEDLFKRIDLTVPWDHPRNAEAFQTRVQTYLRPGFPDNGEGYAPAHYASNVNVLGGDVARTLASFTDGTGNTFVAGEVPANFKSWGDPTNWRDPAKGLNRSPDGFGSRVPGGAIFAFADGSVRYVKDTIDPKVFKAMGTPDGNDVVPPGSY